MGAGHCKDCGGHTAGNCCTCWYDARKRTHEAEINALQSQLAACERERDEAKAELDRRNAVLHAMGDFGTANGKLADLFEVGNAERTDKELYDFLDQVDKMFYFAHENGRAEAKQELEAAIRARAKSEKREAGLRAVLEECVRIAEQVIEGVAADEVKKQLANYVLREVHHVLSEQTVK